MEDITKLPKWAQRHIQFLENQLENFRTMLAQFEGKEKTSIYRIDLLTQKPLPEGTIRFKLSETSWIDCRVQGKAVDVSGSTRLTIEPEATNHIKMSTF
jgi:hypothetical protein